MANLSQITRKCFLVTEGPKILTMCRSFFDVLFILCSYGFQWKFHVITENSKEKFASMTVSYKILKKFLIPGSVLSAAAVKDAKCDNEKRLRASELPIYSVDHCRPPKRDPCSERSNLEEAIGAVRKELWVWYDQYQGYRQKIVEVVEVGKAHTEATLEYLKEESNYMPRVGAIGLSGVAGYVLGMRGGVMRRLLYASVASLTMAGLCYPRYGAVASKEALFFMKKGCAIAYNFVYGGHMTVPVRESPDQAVKEAERAEKDHPPESGDSSSSGPTCYCPDPFVKGHTSPPAPCADDE